MEASQLAPHFLSFCFFRMVSSSSSTRVAVSLALSALSVHAAVSTYDFPIARPTPGYVYEGWEAYDPRQVRELIFSSRIGVIDIILGL